MAFRYQAVDSAGQTLVNTVNANSQREAADLLRQRGLFVTRIDPVDDDPHAAAAPADDKKPGGKLKEVVFFTQQMSMLIRAGSRVVQALEAVEEQAYRPAWRATIHAIRLDVEEGRPLSEALARFPNLFTGIYTSMVAAGEASGDMGLAFERLSTLTRQQQEIKSRVIGALAYPAVLMLLCVAVLVTMFIFVLPRFAEMFYAMDVELPASTAVLISTSDTLQTHWPYAIGAVAAAAGSAVMFLRSATGRRFFSRFSVRVPLFGSLVRRIILARVCRVLGQLIDSKVGLLDAVRLTQQGTANLDFREMLDDIEQTITEGNAIGPGLRKSWLLPTTFAAAIITGEESGRLSDSLLFVASCLEDENSQVLASLARVIEPIMLTVMGVVVGTVAISLFLPMFDMATITGG